MDSPAYRSLLALGEELALLSGVQALLGWDQEVLLPAKGIPYRGRQMAWLSGMAHEQFTRPEVGEWLAAAENELGTPGDAGEEPVVANLREWRHRYDRETRLPKRLVEEFAAVRVEAKAAWAEARRRSEFALFAPHLSRLIDLSREKAAAWGATGARAYDLLLDTYERGATVARVGEVLDDLRARLVPLVEEATSRERFNLDRLDGRYPVEKQAAFNREVAESLGFDFGAGRIDTAVHPFCSGMAPEDTRLTTRYDESNFLSSLFGVLHEAGHGLYEQGLPKDWYGQPAGGSVSLGVHESQSRLWENHVGRSLPFWERWLPRAAEYFPNLAKLSPEDLYDAVNRAELSRIRVEADEVTYDLHVALRFELEQAIFDGSLEPEGIPAEWNRLFESYFGLAVANDAEGCLQDIHWSMGMFGYFPTYSLGNLNAAHLAAAALAEPEVASAFASADYGPLLGWMRQRIHRRGSVLLPDDLVAEAAGTPASAEPLIAHLRRRYLRQG